MQVLNKSEKSKSLIGQFVLTAIALTLPLSIKLGNLAIIFSFALSLLFLKKEHFKVKYPFLIYFPFLFIVISFFSGLLSNNIEVGFSRLDRHLLPLLLTVIFLVFKDISINNVLKNFTYFLTFYTTILIGKLIWGIINGNGLDQLVFHNFTSLFGQHPVYYGLLLLVSAFFLISNLKNDYANVTKDWKWIIQLIILLLGMIFCASKAVLTIFVLLLSAGLISFVKGKRHKVLTFSGLLLMIFCVYQINFLNERFTGGIKIKSNIIHFSPTNDFTLKTQFSLEEKQAITDLELRILFAKISIYHLYKDQKVLFGYGVGDAQDYLDYYLYSYNLGPNWYQGFNLHNQFLHLLFNYGALFLLLFLFFLGKIFSNAIMYRNYLQLVTIIAFCFVFLFEVPLLRNKGIVLFYFFHLIFMLNNYRFENRNIRN